MKSKNTEAKKSRVEKMRDNRIEKIGDYKNFLKGSLVETLTRCGNPNCKCAKGQRHQVLHLSYKDGKKTRRVYIPRDLAGEVRKWINNRKKLLKLLNEIFELNVELIKSTKGRK